jgi:amino acid transporter/mannitol/fructose-specific phosphotransferase system IIA component (Ntr-type)
MALKRELGPVSVFAVAAGAMISSGLFVLPTIVYAKAGPAVFLCYLAAALLLIPAVLSKGELMTAMPKAGGTYYYIDRSLGPGFGTVGGFAAWASLAFKSAFALIGIGALAQAIWTTMPMWEVKAIACAFCVLFATLNAFGVRHAGRVQVVLVGGLLLVLAAFVVRGLASIQMANFDPMFPRGRNAVLVGAAMVFVSFGGVTKVATLGEEVRRPRRDLLIGMFAACIAIGILYVLVAFTAVGVLPVGEGEGSWTYAPLCQAGEVLAGRAGSIVLGAAAMAAFLTTGNAGIMAASRMLMAMAQDDLVPPVLARVTGRGTPVRAIVLTSSFMIATIALLDLELFAKAASAMMILLFMFEMLSVVLMRESRIPTYRPTWRCPFYPWTQVAGILLYAFLLVELGTVPLAITGVILGTAFVWYVFHAKVSVMRESALIRLAERVARADFQDHDLEAELSRVARERDQVMEDRFDHLIQDCTVLDLPSPVAREELFHIIADNLAPSLDLSAQDVYELLLKREALSSTVVRPGLAIPHLIMEGLESFQVILVRSRHGVEFAEGEPPIHALFVMAASPEERNFYLKALVAVAEIAQDEDFDKRWMEAGRVEALREVVLAAERRREPMD